MQNDVYSPLHSSFFILYSPFCILHFTFCILHSAFYIMDNFIINQFKYFSKFVSPEALKTIFVQPGHSRKPGYGEIESETLAPGGSAVIPEIERFIFSINENFVSERIKNSRGIILFVEYGELSVDHEAMQGVRQTVSVTVARNFSDLNNDNLNEVLVMNRCLEILDRIIRQMEADQNDPGFCGSGELIAYPVKIRPIEPAFFYGAGGWSALFTFSKTIL